jgi:hypothetical protein
MEAILCIVACYVCWQCCRGKSEKMKVGQEKQGNDESYVPDSNFKLPPINDIEKNLFLLEKMNKTAESYNPLNYNTTDYSIPNFVKYEQEKSRLRAQNVYLETLKSLSLEFQGFPDTPQKESTHGFSEKEKTSKYPAPRVGKRR